MPQSPDNKCVKETLAAIERETGVVPVYLKHGSSGHLIYDLGGIRMTIAATPSDKARSLQNNVRTAKRLISGMKKAAAKEYAEDKLAARAARAYVTQQLGVPLESLPADWGRKSVRRGHLKDLRENKKSMGGAGSIYSRVNLDELIERLRIRPKTAAFYFRVPEPPPEVVLPEVKVDKAEKEEPKPPSTVLRFDLEGKAGAVVEDLFQLLHDEVQVSIHCEVTGGLKPNGQKENGHPV